MAAKALTARYAPQLHRVLSYDERIIGTRKLPGVCFAGGLTDFLDSRGIRISTIPSLRSPREIASVNEHMKPAKPTA